MVDNYKFDVVVAGSGVGGLCAGALLARHGYRVLLVEKLGRLGGRFSTVEQDGFKLPTGAMAIATRSVFEETAREVGAPWKVNEVNGTTVWMEGQWHDLPEKGQIRALLSILDKIEGVNKAQIMGRLAQGMAGEKILGAFKKRGVESQQPEDLMSFRDWLKQYTSDERVLKVFHALTSAISTVNDFEYPASHWFTYVSAAGQGGMSYHGLAPHGNIEIARGIANTITQRGGEVWLNSPLKQVNVRNNKVTGAVISRDGKDVVVECSVFISDIGPKQTMALVDDQQQIDSKHLQAVNGLRAAPIVANLVASDIPLYPNKNGFLIVGAQRIVAGFQITNSCPEVAPRGQHLLIAWGTPASCLKPINKEEEARINREDIRQVFPDFDQHGRILRQDLRDIDDDFPALRSWMGYDLPQETPLPNLIYVGDAVKPFGWEGLAACAKSGRNAADLVRKKFKPGK